MKLKTFLFITLLCICSTISWGQTVEQTWNLTPTMTATLTVIYIDDNPAQPSRTLTISTTASAEAMPNFNSETEVPWNLTLLPVYIAQIEIKENVTTIGNYAFFGRNSSGGGFKIANTVTVIGDYAFANGGGPVLLPNSVEVIGNYAFANYSSTSYIQIPSSVKVIGDYAFAGFVTFAPDYSLFLTIPNSVISIGNGAFYENPVRYLSISSSVTSIGSQAFGRCESLSEVSVEWTTPLAVPDDIFKDANTSYVHFFVPAGTKSDYQAANGWKYLSTWMNDLTGEQVWKLSPTMTASLSNGVLTVSTTANSEAIDILATPPIPPWLRCGPLRSIVIEDKVTAIGRNFTGFLTGSGVPYNSPLVKSITIPNTVTSIDETAFIGCINLTEMTVAWATPLGIPANLFAGITNMPSIFPPINLSAATLHVPSGTKSLYQAHPVWGQFGTIDDGTPSVQTWQLTPTMTATLDAGVLTISTTASAEAMSDAFSFDKFPNTTTFPWFDVRQSILSVVIEDKVTNIGNGAFVMCNNLTSITIPNSVTVIGNCAFWMSGLSSITIPNSVTSIGGYAFSNTGITEITIPNSVTDIGMFAFSGCYNLTSITIPNSVTYIGMFAFSGCEGLTSITIPSSVTSIENAAFGGCTSLKSVIIPNSVTNIENAAFAVCTGLTDVTVGWATPLDVSSNIFIGGGPLGTDFLNLSAITLHVPSGTKSLYQADPVWGQFGTIIDDGLATSYKHTWILSPTMTATLNTEGVLNVLTTANAEAMPNFPNIAPWYNVRSSIMSAVIADKVTGIRDRTFFGCTSLTSITIPNSVTTIEQLAFSSCAGLTNVTVGWATPLSVPDNIFASLGNPQYPPVNLSAATLHVPSGTKALYQAHPVWGQFGTIDDGTPAYSLSVLPDSLSFVASGEQQSFAITSDTDWTVTSNVSWLAFSQASGNNNAVITVAAVANPDTIQRTATITVSGTGATSQTISVTQAGKVTVIPEETQPVGEDGNGKIEIGLSLPEDATVTGSFEITFPEGMTLDEALTVLSIELSGNFYLSFTYKGNNTWLIEIKSNGLRSASASEYRKIMDIAYNVAPTVPTGSYDTKITNLDLMMSNGTAIQEDLLTIPIHVLQSVNIENIRSTPFYGFIKGNTLTVESPHEEQITVYSVIGGLICSEMKKAGSVEIPVSQPAGSIIFVRGSLSGTIKVVKGSF